MTCLRVVGALALLGLLAACDAPQVTEVTSVPQVARHGGVVLNADGTVLARVLTTAEINEYIEKRLAEDPEFFDTPYEYLSDDGTKTTVTYRDILNGRTFQLQAPAGQQNQSTVLGILSGSRIIVADTEADDGVVGADVKIVAGMAVVPGAIYTVAVQTMTITGISA